MKLFKRKTCITLHYGTSTHWKQLNIWGSPKTSKRAILSSYTSIPQNVESIWTQPMTNLCTIKCKEHNYMWTITFKVHLLNIAFSLHIHAKFQCWIVKIWINKQPYTTIKFVSMCQHVLIMSKAKVGRCYEALMFDVKGWQVKCVNSIQGFCIAARDPPLH